MNTRNDNAMRGGYSLVELLIVVTIMIILIAVTLPTAKYAMEEGKLRESSRLLNAYFATAKTRAAATGRPCGIAFQVDAPVGDMSGTNLQVTQMYLAEVTAPYGGATMGAKARAVSGVLAFPDTSDPRDTNERTILATLLEDNEYFLIRFDYKGDWFKCQRQGTTFLCGNSLVGNVSPPTASGTAGYPFQILRAPRRVGQPRELTAGTCIDLTYSGVGPAGIQFGSSFPSLVVMFNPGGSLAGYYAGTSGTANAAEGTFHFLIGRVEKVGQAGNDSNLADTNALWVSVGRLTGSVTSAENLPLLPVDTSSVANIQNALLSARQAATNREQMGGQ